MFALPGITTLRVPSTTSTKAEDRIIRSIRILEGANNKKFFLDAIKRKSLQKYDKGLRRALHSIMTLRDDSDLSTFACFLSHESHCSGKLKSQHNGMICSLCETISLNIQENDI